MGILKKTRKTGADSSAPPKRLASSLVPWRRATAPFALVCAVCLVALVGCSKYSGTGVELDSSFARYVPAGTKALIGVKVDSLKSSEFYKRHESQLKLPQLSAMQERIGMDPARDLTEIVLAWDGQQVLTIARGNFKSEEVQPKIAKLTPEREQYKNNTLFGSKKEAIVFLPKGIALAGPSDGIKRALDGAGGVPEELKARLHGVLPNAQVWAASYGVLPLSNIPIRSDTQSLLSNLVDYVNGTTLGVALDAGAHLRLEVACISPEGAQRVNDALRGLLGFARLNTPDNQMEMLHLWDAIKVEKNGSGVVVHADLTADLADRLFGQVAGMSKFGR